MHTREDHGTTTAIPDGSQQPYCPPGALWEPGHGANRTSRPPRDTACGIADGDFAVLLYTVSRTNANSSGRSETSSSGKRAGVQVSEPGTPVHPQKMEGKQSARTRGRSGAGHHDERSLFMGGR